MCRVDTKCDEMKVSRRQPMKQRSMKKKKRKNVVCGEAIHDGNAERPVVRAHGVDSDVVGCAGNNYYSA